MQIKYRNLKKYKYELMKDYSLQTDFKMNLEICITEEQCTPFVLGANSFIKIYMDGYMIIHRGYCWDGCSGPTWDTKSTMRAGLVHDALYQLLREGKISFKKVGEVDKLFHNILLEDGVNRFRAWYYFKGVSNPIAHRYAKP